MREWDHRPDEIRYLLNPAFCGRLIYTAIAEYQKSTDKDFPFPLAYIILPLVLPQQIRAEINSRTQLVNWVQKHQDLVFNFGARAKDLIEITNEAIEFMMQTGFVKLTDNGGLAKETNARDLNKDTDREVKECLNKAGQVGRWFAGVGKVETIYTLLGVRP